MIKIPKSWMQHLENASNHCQTFLASCCCSDFLEKTPAKSNILLKKSKQDNKKTLESSPPILDKPPFPIQKLTISLSKTQAHKPNQNPKAIDTNALLKKLQLLQLSKQQSPTPPTTPIIRSMAPSPEPIEPLRKDLENIIDILSGFDLKEETKEIEALEEINKIEQILITKHRPTTILRRNAGQLSKIDAIQQKSRAYQVKINNLNLI